MDHSLSVYRSGRRRPSPLGLYGGFASLDFVASSSLDRPNNLPKRGVRSSKELRDCRLSQALVVWRSDPEVGVGAVPSEVDGFELAEPGVIRLKSVPGSSSNWAEVDVWTELLSREGSVGIGKA